MLRLSQVLRRSLRLDIDPRERIDPLSSCVYTHTRESLNVAVVCDDAGALEFVAVSDTMNALLIFPI